MVNIKEPKVESSSYLSDKMTELKESIMKVGEEVKNLKEFDVTSNLVRMREIIESIKQAQALLLAQTNKEVSLNNYLLTVRSKYVQRVLDEKDDLGKPVHSNETKRELAVQELLGKDDDYNVCKADADKVGFEKKQTVLELDNLKLDLKLCEYALRVIVR